MKKKSLLKLILLISGLLVIAAVIIFIRFYNIVYTNNITLDETEGVDFYINNGDDFDDVCFSLFDKSIILDQNSFLWLAKKKNFPNHIYPGRYFLKSEMSNNELINLLRSGIQKPLNLTFNNIRVKNDLAGVVSGYIQADSISILKLLNNNEFLDQYSYNRDNVLSVFIPNTYQFFWNTSAEKFFIRMVRENKKFWNDERLKKANGIPLSPIQISILASIVQEETNKTEEMDMVAGIYINRLKKGMLLQADPTVKYALGDFSKKRVLKVDTKTDSPYNTYKYAGLPPGPICLPEPSTIDMVLNYEQHNYFYMCAKDDLSGYHTFSKNLREHLRAARKYQRELNKLNIRK